MTTVSNVKNRPIPSGVREQYKELCTQKKNLDRGQCEVLFPDLIAFVRQNTSLVDVIRRSGFKVTPLSDDASGVYIVRGGCPVCANDIFIKEKVSESC